MAESFQVIGQVCPAATTETTLYAVPAATSVVASTLAICNITATAATTDVNVRPGAAAVANVHALFRGVSIDPNSTVFVTVGLTLAATDMVSVKVGTANALTFHLYGTVIV